MQDTNGLAHILKQHLSWDKRRITFFAAMITGIVIKQTVNLSRLKTFLSSICDATSASTYRRAQCLFQHQTFDYDIIARFIVMLFGLSGSICLSIDRTNWQFGKKDINIFMLSIVHEGIAIPVLWRALPKRGNSNCQERMALLARFQQVFPELDIEVVFADREFIGNLWLKWLKDQNIPYCIRFRGNARMTGKCGKPVALKNRFRHLRAGEEEVLHKRVRIYGQSHWLAVRRLGDGDLLAVGSSKKGFGIAAYGKRWRIETLFGCLKSRGFSLEDTHMSDDAKLEKLVALVSIAFCWAYRAGIESHKGLPIKRKSHGRSAASLFQMGLSWITERIFASVNIMNRLPYEVLAVLVRRD
ncbi:MAG: IS4 family transposase [Cardiobacteriaceae bacterium]|nr:IS4 family transposase [Cardiobacteriaceae bacterium]